MNLLHYLCFMFWFLEESRALVGSQLSNQIEPSPPALEGEVLTADFQGSLTLQVLDLKEGNGPSCVSSAFGGGGLDVTVD